MGLCHDTVTLLLAIAVGQPWVLWPSVSRAIPAGTWLENWSGIEAFIINVGMAPRIRHRVCCGMFVVCSCIPGVSSDRVFKLRHSDFGPVNFTLKKWARDFALGILGSEDSHCAMCTFSKAHHSHRKMTKTTLRRGKAVTHSVGVRNVCHFRLHCWYCSILQRLLIAIVTQQI